MPFDRCSRMSSMLPTDPNFVNWTSSGYHQLTDAFGSSDRPLLGTAQMMLNVDGRIDLTKNIFAARLKTFWSLNHRRHENSRAPGVAVLSAPGWGAWASSVTSLGFLRGAMRTSRPTSLP